MLKMQMAKMMMLPHYGEDGGDDEVATLWQNVLILAALINQGLPTAQMPSQNTAEAFFILEAQKDARDENFEATIK